MKIDAYIQGRMGSNRLPGKTALNIGDKTLLERVINRASLFNVRGVLVLTSPEKEDDTIESICKKNYIDCLRNDPVIDRFVQACEVYQPDWFIRVCADSPFLDVEYNNRLIKKVEEVGDKYDYIAYRDKKYPSITGFFAEAVRTEPFIKRYKAIQEHVTYHMYDHSNNLYLDKPPHLQHNYFRTTVDVQEDYEFVCDVYNRFGYVPTSEELANVMEQYYCYRIEEDK